MQRAFSIEVRLLLTALLHRLKKREPHAAWSRLSRRLACASRYSSDHLTALSIDAFPLRFRKPNQPTTPSVRAQLPPSSLVLAPRASPNCQDHHCKPAACASSSAPLPSRQPHNLPCTSSTRRARAEHVRSNAVHIAEKSSLPCHRHQASA